MTEKLYDQDAYAVEFDAKVLSCEAYHDKDESGYHVVLDRTLFFPEEGGQSPDKGTINGIEVTDVQIKKDVVTHSLKEPLAVDENVHGKIDWTHRFNNMQQHSGEHIFSGIVHSRFGYDNVGFHLSDNIVTMDFNGVLTADEVKEIETAVNDVIVKNLPVEITYPAKEELAALDYRSKIEIEGQVRIVTIPGVDVCACCAPHVKRTGEIGTLNVQSLSNYKGGVRISILSGFRALEEEQKKSQIISAISGTLSANQELLPQLVEKLKQSNQDLKYKLAQAKQKLIDQKIKEIPAEQENVLLFETDLDTPVMRNAINGLVEAHDGICGIFVEKEDGGYNRK
jgi:alanyl-tRNA synthetase